MKKYYFDSYSKSTKNLEMFVSPSPAANKIYLLYFFELFVEKNYFYFLLFHHTQTFTHEYSHAYVTFFSLELFWTFIRLLLLFSMLRKKVCCVVEAGAKHEGRKNGIFLFFPELLYPIPHPILLFYVQ